jgi:hypothetical protein
MSRVAAAAVAALVLFGPAAPAARAASAPAAATAAATGCGAGYRLVHAERLPDARRFGTVFAYVRKLPGGRLGACALLDNNTGSRKFLRVTVCSGSGDCATDAGMFRQYAGPVTVTGPRPDVECSTVTAVMKDAAHSGTAVFHRTFTLPGCRQ